MDRGGECSMIIANPESCKAANVSAESKGLNVTTPVRSSFWWRISKAASGLGTITLTPNSLFSQWLIIVPVPPWFSNSTPTKVGQLK